MERIWRREGPKVPQKQKPRGRLWLNDWVMCAVAAGACQSCLCDDFVSAKTQDGRMVRMLNLIDEHIRESLLVRPERRWSSAEVIEALADVMVLKGVPEHIRSDHGPEFVAKDLRKWLADTGAKTLYIEPGSPWENGYCESFNSKLRDSSSTARSSTRSKRCRSWPNAGGFTTTPSDRTRRSVIALRHPKPGRFKRISPGVESWKSLRTSHPAPIQIFEKLRYTNNPAGTKDRAHHDGGSRLDRRRAPNIEGHTKDGMSLM